MDMVVIVAYRASQELRKALATPKDGQCMSEFGSRTDVQQMPVISLC